MSVIFICAVATTMLCIVNSKSKMDDKYKKEEKKNQRYVCLRMNLTIIYTDTHAHRTINVH